VERSLQVLCVGAGVRMLGNALYGPFLVLSFSNLFGIGYLEIGVIIVLLAIVQLPFILVGGAAADRLGRRPLILFGLAGEAATTGVLAYAFLQHSIVLVLIDAVAGGIIGAISGPAFSAYIADLAEGSVRTRAYTWYRIAFNAGFSAGVALGGILVAAWGFAGAVAAASAIIGVTCGALALELRPSPYDHDLTLRRGSPSSSPSAPVATEPARAPSHGMRGSLGVLARYRGALQVALAFLLASFVATQWSVIFPLFVHNVLGIGYSLLGIGLALNGLVVVFGQSSTTSWAIGRKHTTLGILGLALYATAFLTLGAAGSFVIFPTAVFFLAVVVLTFGENVLAIPSGTLPSNLAPPGEVGTYNGAFQVFGQLGFLASTLAGTAVLAATAQPLLIWAVLTLPAIPAVLLLRSADAHIPASANRA
jgi:MFS family permease